MQIARPEMRVVWLDSLRVWAFILLILFHAGMIFNHWSWYVKSTERSTLLTYAMAFVSQFRLPLLFAVSGAATSLFLRHHSFRDLILKRSRVLLPVLALAFLLLTPIQILTENTYRSLHPEIPGLRLIPWTFRPYPEGFISWHHLWFIAYLWLMTFLAALRVPPAFAKLRPLPVMLCLFAACILLRGWNSASYADTRNVWGTWPGLFHYAAFFATGFLLFELNLSHLLRRGAFVFILGGVLSAALLFCGHWLPGKPVSTFADHLLKNLNTACWVFGIFGLAERWRLSAGAWLNPHILWLYVFHQPLQLGVGLVTADVFAHPLLNFFLTALATAVLLLPVYWISRALRR